MHKKVPILAICALFLAHAVSAGVVMVRIQTDDVSLRLEPGFRAQVICQMDKGDVLTRTAMEGEWLQVLPPEKVKFWIHARYVQQGVVTGTRVRVRVGPGVEHAIVDELLKGESVTVRGKTNQWLRIDPPGGNVLWVHRSLIEEISDGPETAKRVKRPSLRRREKKPAADKEEPAIQEKIVEDSVRDTAGPPKVLLDRGLVPLQGQGRLVQHKGTLKKASLSGRGPTGYKLVRSTERKDNIIICYVMGNRSQLSKLARTSLVITGAEYWLKGETHPIVVVEQIAKE